MSYLFDIPLSVSKRRETSLDAWNDYHAMYLTARYLAEFNLIRNNNEKSKEWVSSISLLCYTRQNMFLLCVYLLHLVLTCNSDGDFLCSAEFCNEERKNGECEDTIPQGCQSKGLMLQSPTPCKCCDYCIGYLEENAQCNEGTPGQDTVPNICGPGLTCKDEKCVKMTTPTCVVKQKKYDSHESFAEISWRPVCDGEGDFGPVHCIPNSICFCIEPTNGTRIFGEAIYTSEVAQRMSCACSLAAWKAASLGEKTEFFRCLSNGDYDALQCVDGECMCVDKTTGTPIGTTRVHVSMLEEGVLSCFDEKIHPVGQFERSCEEEYKFKLDEMKTWEQDGMEVLNFELPKCSPDGYYRRVQTLQNESGFKCVDPEGNQIDSYESNEGTSDCNCAYTSWLMKKEGLQELPSCEKDGSFKPWQCSRDKCYCVDSNGDQSTEHVSFSDVELLKCEAQ